MLSNIRNNISIPFLYLFYVFILILFTDVSITYYINHTTLIDNYTHTTHINTHRKYVWNYVSLEKEKNCLAKNIYFEARNQEIKGQVAVALVTINRLKSANYPNTICGVVWQRRRSRNSGKLVPQFSWTLDGKSDIPKSSKAWKQSYMLADTILYNGNLDIVPDFTDGALFYHAIYVSPYWNRYLEHVATIGDHIFYKN